jgi:urease alpha subunit
VDTHITLITPAQIVEQVRSLASMWAGGVGMFITPLYTDSQTPTHYISSGKMDATVADWLMGDTAALVAELNSRGVQTTIEQIQALIDLCNVSTDDPHQAIERAGLSLEQQE